MKREITVVLTVLIGWSLTILALEAAPWVAPTSSREEMDFNADWSFIQKDVPGAEKADFRAEGWKPVTLPHTFNDVDSFDEFTDREKGEANVWEGVAWYRKKFTLPASQAGRKVFLVFDGARQAVQLWVNGHEAGLYEQGVTPFGFDVTKWVQFGSAENVIAVRVDNDENYKEKATGTKFQWAGRKFNPNFGGLNRPVKLVVTDTAYQTFPLWHGLETAGTYVFADKIDVAARKVNMVAETQVRNDSDKERALTLETVVVGADGKAASSGVSASVRIAAGKAHDFLTRVDLAEAKLWSPEEPNLADVYGILREGERVLDVNHVRTGFRKLEFKGGEAGGVFLNDQRVYLKGYAQRATNEWAGLGSAVPAWLWDVDGEMLRKNHANLLRWMHVSAQPAGIRMGDTYGLLTIQPAGDHESDAKDRQWAQRVEVMRDSIIYFRNNPCIVAWEAGNAGINDAHMKEMRALREKWDPKNGRAMGCRSLGEKAVGSAEYIGTMLGEPWSVMRRDAAPVIEAEYMRDEVPRRVWDTQSPPDFKYIHDKSATYKWDSEGFCLEAVKEFLKFYDARTGGGTGKFSGAAVLTWADSNQHGRNTKTEVCRTSGRVDAVRLPKDAYFVHAVLYSETPALHILGHWTYPSGTLKDKQVVASHVAQVELLLNGKSLGVIKADKQVGQIAVFKQLKFEPGTLVAIGKDAGGKELCREEQVTAGAPAALKLTTRTAPGGMKADGQDVAMLDVEVVDAQGRRCPTDQAQVDFEVSGPAVWIGGYNSGKEGSVFKTYLDTECGINRVFVRSTHEAGLIRVVAKRNGLKSATTEVSSR